jgi:hypothetical protein
MMVTLNEFGRRSEELVKIFGNPQKNLRVGAYLIRSDAHGIFLVEDPEDLIPRLVSEDEVDIVDAVIPKNWEFGGGSPSLDVVKIIGYKALVMNGDAELVSLYHYEPNSVFRFKLYMSTI